MQLHSSRFLTDTQLSDLHGSAPHMWCEAAYLVVHVVVAQRQGGDGGVADERVRQRMRTQGPQGAVRDSCIGATDRLEDGRHGWDAQRAAHASVQVGTLTLHLHFLHSRHTMRFGSTTKVLAKRMLTYYGIS